MKRKVRANWDDLGIFYPEGECGGRDVYVPEDFGEAVPTGVLDRDGNMICRRPQPIGFRLRKCG